MKAITTCGPTFPSSSQSSPAPPGSDTPTDASGDPWELPVFAAARDPLRRNEEKALDAAAATERADPTGFASDADEEVDEEDGGDLLAWAMVRKRRSSRPSLCRRPIAGWRVKGGGERLARAVLDFLQKKLNPNARSCVC